MIETAYVEGSWLFAVVNGSRKTITSIHGSDRLEGFTSSGVTYVKGGWRYVWSPNGGTKTINHV